METNNDVISVYTIDGYEVRFDGTDDAILTGIGATRLTDTRDMDAMREDPETVLERLLVEHFPADHGQGCDRYFIIAKGCHQFLVLEHFGQWFVGDNIANTANGILFTVDDFRRVGSLVARYGSRDVDDGDALEELLSDTMEFVAGLGLPAGGSLARLVDEYGENCIPVGSGCRLSEESVLDEALRLLVKVTGYELEHRDRYTLEFSPRYNRVLSEKYGLHIFDRERLAVGGGSSKEYPYYVRELDWPVTARELEHPEEIEWPDGRYNPNDNDGPDWEPNA